MTGYFIVGRKIIMRSFKKKKASYVFSKKSWPHAITSSFLSFKGDYYFFKIY